MKIPSQPQRVGLFVVYLSAMFSTTLLAQVQVVSWGNSASYVFDRDNSQFGHTSLNVPKSTAEFTDSATLSPAADYSAPPGKSGTFYGGYEVTTSAALSGVGQVRIADDRYYGTDAIDYQLNGLTPGGEIYFLSSLTLFKKDDFLTAGATYSLDNTSTFAVQAANIGHGDHAGFGSPIRIVVGQAGNYYISDAFTGAEGGYDGTPSSDTEGLQNYDFGDITTWYPYDPDSGVESGIGATALSSSPLFDDIDSVGVHFRIGRDTDGNLFNNVLRFDATATVPEPSAYALAFGFAAFGLMLIRRMKIRRF